MISFQIRIVSGYWTETLHMPKIAQKAHNRLVLAGQAGANRVRVYH